MADERPIVLCSQTPFRCNNTARRAHLIPGRLPADAVRCQVTLRVQSDWASVQCVPSSMVLPGHTIAVNALTQERFPHADIFSAFSPAGLQMLAANDPSRQDFLTDFLGNRYPPELFCNQAYRKRMRVELSDHSGIHASPTTGRASRD